MRIITITMSATLSRKHALSNAEMEDKVTVSVTRQSVAQGKPWVRMTGAMLHRVPNFNDERLVRELPASI